MKKKLKFNKFHEEENQNTLALLQNSEIVN